MSTKSASYRQLGTSRLQVIVRRLRARASVKPPLAWLHVFWEHQVEPLDFTRGEGPGTLESRLGHLTKWARHRDMYPNGEYERIIISSCFRTRSRQNLVIITKILCLISPDVGSRAAFDPSTPNTRTYTPSSCLQMTHSTARPFDVTTCATHDLITVAEMHHVAEMKVWTQFACMKTSDYSLLGRAGEKQLFADRKSKGIGVVNRLLLPLARRPLDTPNPEHQKSGCIHRDARDANIDKQIKRM
ncbi:hypothetical protein DFH09DRAFT_1330079 [Mycena vulgaris]|nr:hypothetical protein DFH09DRAFT_1330079 [Mycena vulgaris]